MKEFAESFYKSKQWQACRAAFVQSKRGLCEKCLARGVYKPGVIVHHKKHVTPDTINDPAILYGFDNLQLLCRDCHADAHKSKRRYKVLPNGKVIGTH